jgi:transcriptional regulator with XRE-family HTH domain
MKKQEIGRRLKDRRIKMRMRQQDLADAFGVAQPTISGYENGEREITASDLLRFAKILGVPVTYFFDEDDASDYDPNSDAPSADEEGEVLRYFQGIPPMMRPAAKAMLKSLVDAEPDYEEGRVYGRKAE